MLLIPEADEIEHLVCVIPLVVEGAECTKDLGNRQPVRQPRLLQLNAQPLPQCSAIPIPGQPENTDLASIGCYEALEHLDGSRLAGAVRTKEPHALTSLHREVNPIHGKDMSKTLGKPIAADCGVCCS